MTDPASEYADEDAPLGLGIAELSYLLSRFDSASARKSVEMLHVNEDYLSPLVTAVGASSLLARGLLHVNGDEVEPTEALSLVNYIMAASTRWIELGFVGEDDVDGGLLLQAPEASMFLQPLALGAWQVLVKDRSTSDMRTLRSLVDAHFESNPHGAVHFGSTTFESVQTLSVRCEDGQWRVGLGAGGERRDTAGGPDITSEELDRKLVELLSN
ncbi:hypothetical protein [Arthrobacter castelli]|uniref:hypothetical protein n=1 Tax=Arthrobacter castelli TaxID=271431 RepID=UPI000412ADB5|nr:hypothetical protein [Arthrobacter castelli]